MLPGGPSRPSSSTGDDIVFLNQGYYCILKTAVPAGLLFVV